jgi:hypothetical protein
MIKGSALKLPQPVACPLPILHSLTWEDSSFCVVSIATQSSRGEGWGEGKGGGKHEETEKNESFEGRLKKEKY